MESKGVSLPLIHEHLMMPWNDKKKGDCCGRFEATTHGYYCKICDFFVHKKCSQSAEYIKHPFHSGHTLQLKINLTLPNVCDACGKRIQNLSYRCQICDFDLDLYCAKYPPPKVTEVSETHGHKLTLLKERNKFDCGAKCGKIGEYEFPYKCDECDLAFHMDCVWQPEEVKIPLECTTMEPEGVSLPLIHDHLMVRGNYLGRGNCCGRFESITDGFYCNNCDFFVHEKCSELAEYIEHPYHSDHILQLQRNVNHICNLCAKTIVTLFYRCQICDFDIDLHCVSYPPPEFIQLTPSHKLILLKKRSEFNCHANCGKTSKREYAYKCHECDIAFHVDCIWNPLEVKHPKEVKTQLKYMTMEHEGVSLPLIHEHLMVHGNYLGKGDCCGRFESITDGFYCKGCDFFVHKSCSESSEYIKHPLHSDHTLQLGRYTTSRDPKCFCDLCGLVLGHQLIYRCEICDFDVHLYCAKYPPPEVIEVSETHDHKLTLFNKWVKFDCGAKCGKTQNGTPYKCDECDLSFHIDCIWHPVEAKHPVEARRNDEQVIYWAELRQTLMAVQEKLTNVVLQQQKQYAKVVELNPLAEGGVCCDSGAGIPEFHGNVKGEEVLDWFVVVEEILEFKEVPEDRKVALVATKFRGKAAIWWFQLKATRRRAGKEKVKSWEKLQKLLRKGFLPYKFDQTMYNRLQNLGQGDRSVDDYADEFSLLITRNEIFDTEVQLVSRFIRGLRPIIRSSMTQFEPTTVAKAHARAVEFEQELKSSSSAWSTDTNRGSGPFANSYSEK